MDESIFRSVNKLNILFLKIDEVLNCTDKNKLHKEVMFLGKNTHDRFSPDLMTNINNLIARYNMKVVISSTWRKLFDFITLTDILQNQMGLVGEVIDCTTTYYLDIDYRARYEDDPTAMSRDRGLQITRWLKERKYNVSNYLVIDDSLDASYGHESNYHRTFGNRGFDLESYNECINKFDSLCMEK